MVLRAMHEHSIIDLCFLDFSKAFDVVSHRIFCAKLAALRVSYSQRSVLPTRRFQMYISSAISTEAPTPRGVLQGSITGPRIFISKINDLPGELPLFSNTFAEEKGWVVNPLT